MKLCNIVFKQVIAAFYNTSTCIKNNQMTIYIDLDTSCIATVFKKVEIGCWMTTSYASEFYYKFAFGLSHISMNSYNCLQFFVFVQFHICVLCAFIRCTAKNIHNMHKIYFFLIPVFFGLTPRSY